MNKIEIGNYTFTDEDILNGTITMSHSVIGESLAADGMTFNIAATHTGDGKLFTKFLEWYHTVSEEGFVVPGMNIDNIPYASEVYYYIDDNLKGKFFVTSITRTGKFTYKVDCTSAVGLLITSDHLGGIYGGVTAATVIADILEGITYTLDAEMANATIRGYLPVATKRDNLQQVLFAIGGAVKISSTGTLQIMPMSELEVSEIDADRIYMGGQVKKSKAYDGVKLTEHNYFVSQEEETLFDDTITGQQLITFKEPHHSYSITGGTIDDSGANYCLVSPEGSASSIVLTGKKYTHAQRVITAGTTSVTGKENIMTVSGAYLANPEIADALAERVWNYAQCNDHIIQDIIVGVERPGDMVKVLNPYTMQSVSACLTSMDITMSKTNKAKTEYLVGYEPEGVVSGFRYYKIITEDTEWYKDGDYVYVDDEALVDEDDNPVTVDKLRIICIGGGSGGAKAKDGSAGAASSADFERYSSWSSRGSGYDVDLYAVNPGAGGTGGSGGKAGNGGSVFEISMDLSDGDAGSITIGTGGAGSSDVRVEPGIGTETYFTIGNLSYSSATGRKYPYGYVEAKSGITFSNKGIDGANGGAGGSGANDTESSGTNGESVFPNAGGQGSAYYSTHEDRTTYSYYGAGGGGASGSSNGSNASSNNGGAGANGANGANATNYGAGGSGGHGGGGGGGASIRSYDYNPIGSGWDANVYNGTGGAAGTGGNGGNGKQGCLIIYY